MTCRHSPGVSCEPAVTFDSADQLAFVIAEYRLEPPLEGVAKRYLSLSGPSPNSHWKPAPPFHLAYVDTVTLSAFFSTPFGILTYGDVAESPDILNEPPSTPVPNSGVRA